MASSFTESVVSLLKAVPSGRVVSYGSLAREAGFPRAARQVVRILHTQTRSRGLPWHRVVNAAGRVSLKDPDEARTQRALLEAEGVVFDTQGTIDLSRYGWDFKSLNG